MSSTPKYQRCCRTLEQNFAELARERGERLRWTMGLQSSIYAKMEDTEPHHHGDNNVKETAVAVAAKEEGKNKGKSAFFSQGFEEFQCTHCHMCFCLIGLEAISGSHCIYIYWPTLLMVFCCASLKLDSKLLREHIKNLPIVLHFPHN